MLVDLMYVPSFSPHSNAHMMFGAQWGSAKDSAAQGMALHAPDRAREMVLAKAPKKVVPTKCVPFHHVAGCLK